MKQLITCTCHSTCIHSSCEGPVSTPAVSADLANQLMEADVVDVLLLLHQLQQLMHLEGGGGGEGGREGGREGRRQLVQEVMRGFLSLAPLDYCSFTVLGLTSVGP